MSKSIQQQYLETLSNRHVFAPLKQKMGTIAYYRMLRLKKEKLIKEYKNVEDTA